MAGRGYPHLRSVIFLGAGYTAQKSLDGILDRWFAAVNKPVSESPAAEQGSGDKRDVVLRLTEEHPAVGLYPGVEKSGCLKGGFEAGPNAVVGVRRKVYGLP